MSNDDGNSDRKRPAPPPPPDVDGGGGPTDNNNNKRECSSGFGIFDDANEDEKSTPQKVVVPDKNNTKNMSNDDGNSDRKRPAPPPDDDDVVGGAGTNNHRTSHNKKGKTNDDTTTTVTAMMTTTSSTMTRKCAQCEEIKPRCDFSNSQWQKKTKKTNGGGGGSRCTSCVQQRPHLHQRAVAELFKCGICQEEKPKCDYQKSQLKEVRAEQQRAGALLEPTSTTTQPNFPHCRSCVARRLKQQQLEVREKNRFMKQQHEQKMEEHQEKKRLKEQRRREQQPAVELFKCCICQEEKPKSRYTRLELKEFRAEKEALALVEEPTTATTQYNFPNCRSCVAKRVKQQRLEEEERRQKEWQEKERLRNLPRPCQKCGQVKPNDAYSTHQWDEYTHAIRSEDDIVNSTKQTCSMCYPAEQEQADREEAVRKREEAERERIRAAAGQAKKQARKRFWKMAKAGKMHYAFPDMSHYGSTPAFQNIPTTNNDHGSLLEGSYDILFQRVHCDSVGSESHTTRGSLKLLIEKNNNEEEKEGPGRLVGTITFPDDLPISMANCFNVGYTIVEVVDPNKNDDHDDCCEIKFELTEESLVQTHSEGCEEPVEVSLKIISRTIQCPWKGSCGHPWMDDRHVGDVDAGGFLDDDYDDYSSDDEPFETLEEALDRREKQERSQSTDSWICHHLLGGKLPNIAQHIHEYVAWRPDPVFCFQKGDLLLMTDWDYETRSHLFARKKKE